MNTIAINAPHDSNLFSARITESRKEGPVWAQFLIFAWLLQSNMRLPGDTVILYGLTALIVSVVALNAQRWLALAIKAWPLFLIPVLGILSFVWADYPAAAIREGAFFTLSAISVVAMAMLLSPAQIIRMMFLASIIGTVFVVPSIGALETGGTTIMGGKNFFAMKMMMGMICAYSIVLNANENLFLRLLAVPIVLLDFFLVTKAQSATALVLCVVALIGLTAMYLFWINLQHIRGIRTTVIMFGIGLIAFIALMFLSFPNNDVVKSFLESIGKDSTLTGRTSIWEWGKHVADERPMLGVGLGSFWQYDVGIAQTLAENDHRAAGWKLTFHNAYLETRVHLGYIGMFAFIGTIIWTVYRNLRQFMITPTMYSATFFLCSLIALSMTFTESILFGFFHTGVIMFYIGAVCSLTRQDGDYVGDAIVSVDPDGQIDVHAIAPK